MLFLFFLGEKHKDMFKVVRKESQKLEKKFLTNTKPYRTSRKRFFENLGAERANVPTSRESFFWNISKKAPNVSSTSYECFFLEHGYIGG